MAPKARGEQKGKGKQKPDLSEVAKEISTMQEDTANSYRKKTFWLNSTKKAQAFQETVGGFILGYELDESLLDGESDMAEGLLIVECHSKTSPPTQHPATFVKLQAKAGRATAERIFAHSMKVRGSTAVATPHLIANCGPLNRWIICYEKITGYLTDKVKSLEPVYDADNEMKAYWQKQLREIITVLSDMGSRGTFHGGMSIPQNYIISSSGDIKLIGVRKTEDQKTTRDDIVELEAFLTVTTTASSSPDWAGFKALISSDAMWRKDTWAGALLGHSLLLDPAGRKKSYVDLYVWTDRILYSEKIRFCNALWCLLPTYHGNTLKTYISNCQICLGVFGGGTYDGKIIYMDIITFVKNLILHGSVDLRTLLGIINGLFPGFMSVAYAVSKFERADMNRLFQEKGYRLPYSFPKKSASILAPVC